MTITIKAALPEDLVTFSCRVLMLHICLSETAQMGAHSLWLMRERDILAFSEGLSQCGGPKCVTTVFTASNRDRPKLATS